MTASQYESTLTPVQLQDALRGVFPGVALVPSWLLREVIWHDRSGGTGFYLPRQQSYGIDRARLEQLASRERLPLDGALPGEDRLVLLTRPESSWLSSAAAPLVLRFYWRQLFHARVVMETLRGLGSAAHQPGAARAVFERLAPGLYYEAR